MTNLSEQTWENFIRRFSIGFNQTLYPHGFYAVVTEDGDWVDSSPRLTASIFIATQYLGVCGEDGQDDCRIAQTGHLSFVHSSQLKRLFEAGLIR